MFAVLLALMFFHHSSLPQIAEDSDNQFVEISARIRTTDAMNWRYFISHAAPRRHRWPCPAGAWRLGGLGVCVIVALPVPQRHGTAAVPQSGAARVARSESQPGAAASDELSPAAADTRLLRATRRRRVAATPVSSRRQPRRLQREH